MEMDRESKAVSGKGESEEEVLSEEDLAKEID